MKLHLGCGQVAPYGWVNVDYSWNARLAKIRGARPALARLRILPRNTADVPWSRDIVIHDLRKPLPFAEGSASCVYTSHCLEHLTRENGRRLLAECHRVLRSGGILRVLVPDLLQLAERYIVASRAQSSQAAVDFLTDLDVFPAADDRNPLIRLYRAVHNSYHKWFYDESLLTQLFKDTGFSDVRRRGFHESAIEDIAAVEAAIRFDKSICVEAKR